MTSLNSLHSPAAICASQLLMCNTYISFVLFCLFINTIVLYNTSCPSRLRPGGHEIFYSNKYIIKFQFLFSFYSQTINICSYLGKYIGFIPCVILFNYLNKLLAFQSIMYHYVNYVQWSSKSNVYSTHIFVRNSGTIDRLA